MALRAPSFLFFEQSGEYLWRANDPDAFPGSLFEWIRELGVEEVEELVLY